MKNIILAIVLSVATFFAGCVDYPADDWSAEIIESRNINGNERRFYVGLHRCLGLDIKLEPFPTMMVAKAETLRCGEVEGAFGCTIDPDTVIIDERFLEEYEVIHHEWGHILHWRAEGKPDKYHRSTYWDGSCEITEEVIIIEGTVEGEIPEELP